MAERKRTKAEERAYAELHDMMLELEAVRQEMAVRFEQLKVRNLPPEWALVEERNPVRRRKVRITASYDDDVARFFRAMGLGYQGRMNAVLRAYMAAILSRELSSRKNEDWMGEEI